MNIDLSPTSPLAHEAAADVQRLVFASLEAAATDIHAGYASILTEAVSKVFADRAEDIPVEQGEYLTAVLLSFTVIVDSLITKATAAEPDAVRAVSDDEALTFAKQLVDELGVRGIAF